MKDVLSDIQSGSFANRWIAVQDAGGGEFRELRERDRNHQIEQVGADLRAQMPFLNPVVVQAGEAQASATSAATPTSTSRAAG
jgi:ketol-acid reductoisomerase